MMSPQSRRQKGHKSPDNTPPSSSNGKGTESKKTGAMMANVKKILERDSRARGPSSSPIYSSPQKRQSPFRNGSSLKTKNIEEDEAYAEGVVADLSKEMERAADKSQRSATKSRKKNAKRYGKPTLFSPTYDVPDLRRSERIFKKREAIAARMVVSTSNSEADADVVAEGSEPEVECKQTRRTRREEKMKVEDKEHHDHASSHTMEIEDKQQKGKDDATRKKRRVSEDGDSVATKTDVAEKEMEEEQEDESDVSRRITTEVVEESESVTELEMHRKGANNMDVRLEVVEEVEESMTTIEDIATEEFSQYALIAALPMLSVERSHIQVPCLPPKPSDAPAVTIVLDLDETLVHATTVDTQKHDITFDVEFGATIYNVFVRRRPFVMEFLERASQIFEVVVFTASQRVYADRLLDILDPQSKFIKHRLFRDSCVAVEGNFLKDLTVLGRDLSKVFIIDNSPVAFGLQVENGIPIESWYDNDSDKELLSLLPLLEKLSSADDVRPLIKNTFRLEDKVKRVRSRLEFAEPDGF